MDPRLLRGLVLGVFVAGITGMIVGSIQDNNGVAITFGLVSASAALCLIVATAAGPPAASGPSHDTAAFDAEVAEELETRIGALVDAGADEEGVRDLVRWSVRLGASRRR